MRVGHSTITASSPLLADYFRAAEAAVALCLAALMVAFMPFRNVVRTAAWRGAAIPRGDPDAVAEKAAVAIDRAARRLPLRLVCIQRSLALQWMLRRRGHPAHLHYGILNERDRLTAHVWVSLAGQILLGEAGAATHACVTTIPAHPL